MSWNAFDLNLLVVFNAVAQEKNFTRAGQLLGLSQPAVSHALARLRHVLKDEEPEEFDASQTSRSYTIAANNYAARAVIPALARRMAKIAPSLVLEVRPIGAPHVLDQLDAGGVELALTTLTEGGDRFKCVGLLDDEYVAILSSDNPVATEPELSIEAFASLPHITITSSGDDTNFIDDALADRGLARLVSAKVPLHSLILMLVGSEALAVVPRRVAADLVASCPLTMHPLPFFSPRVSLSMIWHRRLDNHPAHRWLRGTLRAVTAGT
jgi:DNA-binding transcriptional LysR family regulator